MGGEVGNFAMFYYHRSLQNKEERKLRIENKQVPQKK